MNDNIVLPIPNLSTENENKKVPKTGQILAADWEKCDLYFKSKRLFVVYVEWIYFSFHLKTINVEWQKRAWPEFINRSRQIAFCFQNCHLQAK